MLKEGFDRRVVEALTLSGLVFIVALTNEGRNQSELNDQAHKIEYDTTQRVSSAINAQAAGKDGIMSNQESRNLLDNLGINYDLPQGHYVMIEGASGGKQFDENPRGYAFISEHLPNGKCINEQAVKVSLTQMRQYLANYRKK